VAEIAIRGATKTYDGGVLAVDAIDLDVADGELLVLVGPSGCGKSTLLRMVAGLEEITSGTVHIGGRDVTELAPKDRDVAMVFQSYALYPHMTVRKNIGYPLRLAKVAKPDLERRVAEVARLLQLDEVLDRRPSQLSGGQRQRVAMGRALVREPQAFLMDEPLSNLDAKLRVEMRAEIARLQRTLGVTTLYVTHDQVEAMTMGTRVAVLDKGRLQQVDTPQRIYDAPRNLFVATFMGSPAMNLLPGTLVRDGDDGLVLDLGAQRLPVDAALRAAHPGLVSLVGQRVIVGVRPEAFDDASLAPDVPGDRVLEATVDLVESLGNELMVHVALTGVTGAESPSPVGDGGPTGSTGSAGDADTDAALVPGAVGDVRTGGNLVTGAEVEGLRLAPPAADDTAHWSAVVGRGGRAVARMGTRSRVRPGDTVKLAVDPTGVHLFDSTSGVSLRTTGS
ncbi:MAG TPA: sn-glycerol-3-phosphate ABC transporter ATP-binding protein UgpC, partial [Acidimicrobiales bacterium]|nr:sn-glycerol-3-phosphate ABC transporter ATP-binding protein UgpC [Acidimicrobiales bacterium]